MIYDILPADQYEQRLPFWLHVLREQNKETVKRVY